MPGRDPADAIDTLREKLENGERGGSDRDREALLKLSDHIHLIPSKLGDYRHRDILRQGTIMSEQVDGVDLVDVVEDKEAAETFVLWIHREHDDSEETNKDYRSNLRMFGKYYLQVDEVPEPLAWIPTGTSNDYNPTPSERDILTFDEVKRMAERCKNSRDAALIMLQFEAGLRSGELYDLRVGDVFDGDHTVGVHVDGKTGERPVHLLVAVPYLKRWLDDHPAGADPDAPLWSKLTKPELPADTTFRNYLKDAAKRVDVNKVVTPTAFRKANTRWLVKLGWSQPEIEDRQGRKRGSDHTARYMATFSADSLEQSYASLHGKEVGDTEPDAVAPLECPRCTKETPRDRDRCMWCGFALSHEAADEARTERQQALAAVGDLATREDLDTDAVVDTIDRLIDERVDARLANRDGHD